jgi:hypothetical protein
VIEVACTVLAVGGTGERLVRRDIAPWSGKSAEGGREELPTLLGEADRHLARAGSEGRSRVPTG